MTRPRIGVMVIDDSAVVRQVLGGLFQGTPGFELVGVDVGDTVPRSVSLDMASGAVQMRRGAAT